MRADDTTARLIASTDAMLAAAAANRVTPAKPTKRKATLVGALLHLFH